MDSGATEHYPLDAIRLYDYVTANPGATVEVANDTHGEVKGYGKLDLLVKQPGEIVKTTNSQRVALCSSEFAPSSVVSETDIEDVGE